MELTRSRKRRRTQRRFIDVVKEDVRRVGVTEEGARDRMTWRQMICCGDAWRERPKNEKEKAGFPEDFLQSSHDFSPNSNLKLNLK